MRSGKATISKLAEFQLISYKFLGQKVKVKMWMLKMNAKTIIIYQLKLTGESVDSFIHHGGQHVELGRAEQLGVEDALHVPGSEGPPGEGHRGGGGGAELEVEGVQEGVDDGSLE